MGLDYNFFYLISFCFCFIKMTKDDFTGFNRDESSI